MKYSIAIIDMQKKFFASSNKDTLKACRAAIRQAIKDNAHIIFVEYEGYGRTLYTLTSIAKNYANKSVVIKSQDDGSEDIKKTIDHLKLPHRLIKVVGVNTDCCVYHTIAGLFDAYREYDQHSKIKIQVIEKACNSTWYHEKGINNLKAIGVTVL